MLRLTAMSILAAIALQAVSVPSAHATRFEVTADAGVFLPLRNVFEYTGTLPATELEGPGTYSDRWGHQSAAALGGRLTMWLNQRFAVEGTVVRASGDFEFQYDEVRDGHTKHPAPIIADATVLLVSARGLCSAASMSAVDLVVGAGIAVINRDGAAFENMEGLRDVGAVFGVGGVVHLSPAVAIRLNADSYLSSISLDAGGRESTPRRLQADMIISFGMALAFHM